MSLRIKPHSVVCGMILALFLILPAATSWAGTILIDFNDNAGAGFGWNTFHNGNDGTTQGLVWDDGTASGISIALPTFNDSGNAGWNPANTLPAWAPNSVANDYSFFNASFDGGTATAQFVLSGLDASMTYTLDIVSSRNLNRNQDFTVTHGGGVEFHDDWNSQADGWVLGNVLTFSNLSADALGEIILDIDREGVSANFNAFRITSIPEPNTFVLTALGLMALGLRKQSLSGAH